MSEPREPGSPGAGGEGPAAAPAPAPSGDSPAPPAPPFAPHGGHPRWLAPATLAFVLLTGGGLSWAAIRGPVASPNQAADRPADSPAAPGPTQEPAGPAAQPGTGEPAGPASQADGPADQAASGPPPAEPSPPAAPKDYGDRPDHVRGLYLTGYTAGGPRFHQLLAFAKGSGLNAMVIDVKDDDGRISFRSANPLAREIGANTDKIRDLGALVRTLEENDIYPIARLVVFVDPVLSRARPEWAIRVGGALWRDRRGLSWTDPNVREVWEYNVEIAKEAARAGFREIQFDYVRFPEKGIPGVTDGVPREQRTGAINGFLRYARERLQPLGVLLSADVFGLTTTVTDDMKIGQDYAAIAGLMDYISPMVYPSHYAPGNYGLANPNARPYDTVYNSMMKAREKTPDLPLSRHRPWIQDFSLGVRYGKAEVEAQIRALADAGIQQFLLWNPNNVYTPGVDYSLIDRRLPPQEPPAPRQPADAPPQQTQQPPPPAPPPDQTREPQQPAGGTTPPADGQ